MSHHRQLGYWRDDETLWRYTLTVTEGNYMAHNNLALALVKQGRNEEQSFTFGGHGPAQISGRPGSRTRLLRIAYRTCAGRDRECNSVLRNSADPKAQAAAWSEMGLAHLQLRNYDRAATSYQNALRLSPENGMALIGSGILALRQEQPDVAVSQFATP